MNEDEATFSADGRYITTTDWFGIKNTYEVVDAVPHGYFVWNIGRPVAKEYIPLCKLSKRQPFPGGRSIDAGTLKAIWSDGAQVVLDAICYGAATLEEMERYIEENRAAQPKSIRHAEVERIKAALPFMRSLRWE